MAFGNADLLRQIIGQLGQLGADLAALKQQVGDQQHAIDLIRQDTTAAINTGLTENRAVIRDGLARTNETVSGPLASIGSELVAVRSGIGQLDNQIKTATAANPPAAQEREPEPAPEPAPVEDQTPPNEADDQLLRAAAGISAAELQMHRDTWAFLIEQTAGDEHFHIPGKVDDQEGAVIVRVSGPSLVAAITSLDRVNRSAPNSVTRAIAGHLHARLTETVEEIITRPHRGVGAEPVRIIIDDRAGGEDEQPQND